MNRKKRNNVLRLMDYAGGHKWLTVIGCLLSGVSALLALVPYFCIWLAIREVLIKSPGGTMGDPAFYGWMAVIFAAVSIVVYFGALMCTHLAAFRAARNLRETAVTHILDLPLGFFSSNQSGRLRKLIDENADLTESLLAHQLPDLTGAVVTPAAALVLMLLFDWRMGLSCIVLMAFGIFLLTRMLGGSSAGFFKGSQMALEDMSSQAVEYVRGIPVVKVFQQTVYSFKSFYHSIIRYRDLASGYSMGLRLPMTGFTTAMNAVYLVLIPVGMSLFLRAADGREVLLDFLFYIMFAPACAMMIMRIVHASESLMQADEAVRKMDTIMEEKPLPEPEEEQLPRGMEIRFEGVTFAYPGTKEPALKNISFTAKAGTTTALVGPSGGGKTTAANLIPRFWDVQSGSVSIGGTDVRRISSRELMSRVAFVFQDTKLFKESLLENIRQARPDATREEVLAAAKAAQCEEILEKLSSGLDTVVGAKGVYLSGGEAQRIALARAILKDAPIIVLDEATAFADPENEHQIQRGLEQLMKGKTVLMIAHRLSTVQKADQILVIEEGTVRERGNHESLLKKEGIYAAMWKSYQSAAVWKVGKEAAV